MACLQRVPQIGRPENCDIVHKAVHTSKQTQINLGERLFAHLSSGPPDVAQHDSSGHLSQIHDVAYNARALFEKRTDSVVEQDHPREEIVDRRVSKPWTVINSILDQDQFTENLVRRLLLVRRLSATAPNTLPPVIETYFKFHTIRITKAAAHLPAMAANVFEQIPPLLALNIRNLEFHIKLSCRPLYGGLQHQDHSFEVKPEHISNCQRTLPKIVERLPALRNLIIVLDTLFDLPPRPRDYQRFLQVHHNYAGSSREEKIKNSDLMERLLVVIVPTLRHVAEAPKLGRVAIKYHSGLAEEEVEVVNRVGCTDDAVAEAVLDKHGREVVVKGWL